jgi:hypothetical protein
MTTASWGSDGARSGVHQDLVDIQTHIRQARPTDRGQLAQLHEALWTETSAAEHARELEPILTGDTPGVMPLVNFVAENSDGTLAGFAEADLRSHADGCASELYWDD